MIQSLSKLSKPLKNPKLRAGLLIISSLVVLAAISVASPSNYKNWYSYQKDLPPSISSLDTLLGTTTNGRSVFWILVNAVKNSLYIGAVTSLIVVHIALLVGLIAGYRGGFADRTLMLLADSFIVIPGILLLTVLFMILRNIVTINSLPLFLSITGWAATSRSIRSLVLSIREKESVIEAMLSGESGLKIITREILPYIMPIYLIDLANAALGAIAAESGLALLGLSILGEDTLGTMIYWALNYNALLRGIWWWLAPPVIVLIILFIGLYLVALGLNEYYNPKIRRGVILL